MKIEKDGANEQLI